MKTCCASSLSIGEGRRKRNHPSPDVMLPGTCTLHSHTLWLTPFCHQLGTQSRRIGDVLAGPSHPAQRAACLWISFAGAHHRAAARQSPRSLGNENDGKSQVEFDGRCVHPERWTVILAQTGGGLARTILFRYRIVGISQIPRSLDRNGDRATEGLPPKQMDSVYLRVLIVPAASSTLA